MDKNFEQTAMRVSFISILVNIALSVFKLFAGIIAHSSAMLSDAVHSASDVFSTIVVMIGVKLSAKDSDEKHPYGHERLECVAASILATVLALTGFGIGYSAVMQIIQKSYSDTVPGTLALIAAFVSILAKEAMYHYTRYHARKIDSAALMADAWHHRSDALSSIGALIGIAAARAGLPILDPLAGLLICLFIEKAAFDIYKDAMDKMIDEACDADTEAEIRSCVLKQEGVLGIDMLQTRLFGNKIYVDLEIRADGTSSLTEAHEVAERVHNTIETTFPKVKHIMVHVNPTEP
ncbi:MAG: cation diffusion facilitator family transporter [Lachnospiraceae bacterium]|nr:cation diffusion facilitator family transporter [Lachnospiraceae bacterium]